MGTAIPAAVRDYQNKSCALDDYPSSVDSGIVGHPGTNTYHQSINDIPNKNGYTNYWKNDKAPPGDWDKGVAVACDQSKSRSDMIKGWNRWKKVFDDKTDPRRDVCAEYIGTPDGFTAYRLDFADGSVEESDDSHTWHEHKARWRKYAHSNEATVKMLSIDKGETKDQYLASIGQGGSTGEEDDVKTLLGKITGRGTVWRGMGMPGTLMALHSERAYNDLKAQGATEYWYGGSNPGDAGSLIDVLGTLPLAYIHDEDADVWRWETWDENYGRTRAAVEAAG